MNTRMAAVGSFLISLVFLTELSWAEDASLALLDLPGYREALRDQTTGSAPSVSFQELWTHSGSFRGRRIQVAGRVVRIFHQTAIGTFPALVEVWLLSSSGDPFCLVYPEDPGRNILKRGQRVSFVGTYLRQIRYSGTDVDRLAPWIVGASPPRPVENLNLLSSSWSGTGTEMLFGGAVAGLVLMMVVRKHLSRPFQRPELREPDPTFVDGGAPDRVEFTDGFEVQP